MSALAPESEEVAPQDQGDQSGVNAAEEGQQQKEIVASPLLPHREEENVEEKGNHEHWSVKVVHVDVMQGEIGQIRDGDQKGRHPVLQPVLGDLI